MEIAVSARQRGRSFRLFVGHCKYFYRGLLVIVCPSRPDANEPEKCPDTALRSGPGQLLSSMPGLAAGLGEQRGDLGGCSVASTA